MPDWSLEKGRRLLVDWGLLMQGHRHDLLLQPLLGLRKLLTHLGLLGEIDLR
ncbi:MAG: hypothetical protein GY832_36495 [Chloroflexi bacterium]|nr:hypothetical protein [Chloroflexota bacterium]